MKKITLYALSLLIAGSVFSEDKARKQLVIGKIVPSNPESSKIIPVKPRFPKHWGHPPEIQTRDMVELPYSFGRGSSTLAHWIMEKITQDVKDSDSEEGKKKPKPKPPVKPKPKPDRKSVV